MEQKISEHFFRKEFTCKCGCGQDTVDSELLAICEIVRVFVGVPITPSSGNRCPKHNLLVGGSLNSQHLKSKAADLPVPDPFLVYTMLCDKFPGHHGFGLYDSFVHVDSRSWKARWDLRSEKGDKI